MPKQLKLTPDWDLDLSVYNLQLVDGLDALVQQIKSRLLTFYGEWYQDVERGVDYFNYIYVKDPDFAVIERLLSVTILDTPGVIRITEFTMDLDRATRHFNVSFRVETVYGTTLVETEL